jgi:hypothetical protein
MYVCMYGMYACMYFINPLCINYNFVQSIVCCLSSFICRLLTSTILSLSHAQICDVMWKRKVVTLIPFTSFILPPPNSNHDIRFTILSYGIILLIPFNPVVKPFFLIYCFFLPGLSLLNAA